jgi:hypothetical protein
MCSRNYSYHGNKFWQMFGQWENADTFFYLQKKKSQRVKVGNEVAKS